MPDPADKTEPAEKYPLVTPSATPLPRGLCRAIRCSEDGFLNLTDYEGDLEEDVAVFKGDNPLRAKIIDEPSTGDAPAQVRALY